MAENKKTSVDSISWDKNLLSALRAFPGMEAKAILERLIQEFADRILITSLPGLDDVDGCELKVTFDKGRVIRIDKEDETAARARQDRQAEAPPPGESRPPTPPEGREDEGTLHAQVAE
jgi:hypothetical protein